MSGLKLRPLARIIEAIFQIEAIFEAIFFRDLPQQASNF